MVADRVEFVDNRSEIGVSTLSAQERYASSELNDSVLADRVVPFYWRALNISDQLNFPGSFGSVWVEIDWVEGMCEWVRALSLGLLVLIIIFAGMTTMYIFVTGTRRFWNKYLRMMQQEEDDIARDSVRKAVKYLRDEYVKEGREFSIHRSDMFILSSDKHRRGQLSIYIRKIAKQHSEIGMRIDVGGVRIVFGGGRGKISMGDFHFDTESSEVLRVVAKWITWMCSPVTIITNMMRSAKHHFMIWKYGACSTEPIFVHFVGHGKYEVMMYGTSIEKIDEGVPVNFITDQLPLDIADWKRQDYRDTVFPGDTLTYSKRLLGGAPKAKSKASAKPAAKKSAPKKTGKATTTSLTPLTPTFENDPPSEVTAWRKTVDIVTKMKHTSQIEERMLDLVFRMEELTLKHTDDESQTILKGGGILLDQMAGTNTDEVPAVRDKVPVVRDHSDLDRVSVASSVKVQGSAPLCKSKQTSGDYELYRQRLKLWFAANAKCSMSTLLVHIEGSFEQHELHHLMRSCSSWDEKLTVDEIVGILDTYFRRNKEAEKLRLVAAWKALRQGASTLSQHLQDGENLLKQLESVYSLDSQAPVDFLFSCSTVSEELSNSIFTKLQEHSEKSPIDRVRQVIADLRPYAVQQEASSAYLEKHKQKKFGVGKIS